MKISRYIFIFNLLTQSTAHAAIQVKDLGVKLNSNGRAPAVVYGPESPKQMGKFDPQLDDGEYIGTCNGKKMKTAAAMEGCQRTIEAARLTIPPPGEMNRYAPVNLPSAPTLNIPQANYSLPNIH